MSEMKRVRVNCKAFDNSIGTFLQRLATSGEVKHARAFAIRTHDFIPAGGEDNLEGRQVYFDV